MTTRSNQLPVIIDEALLPGSKLSFSSVKSWGVKGLDTTRQLESKFPAKQVQSMYFTQKRTALARTPSAPAEFGAKKLQAMPWHSEETDGSETDIQSPKSATSGWHPRSETDPQSPKSTKSVLSPWGAVGTGDGLQVLPWHPRSETDPQSPKSAKSASKPWGGGAGYALQPLPRHPHSETDPWSPKSAKSASQPWGGGAGDALQPLRRHSCTETDPQSPKSARSASKPWSAGGMRVKAEGVSPTWTSLPNTATAADVQEPSADPHLFSEKLLPQPFKELDFWKALHFFDLFDRQKTGELTKDNFCDLLNGVMRERLKPDLSRQQCEAIFHEIDMDESGSVDREEFLSWVFQTPSTFIASVRRRLEKLEPRKVYDLIEQVDDNSDGVMDIKEFSQLIQMLCPNSMSQDAIKSLFVFIDSDKSGTIDVEEFLNWIHSGRELRMLLGQQEGQDANGYARAEQLRGSAEKQELLKEIATSSQDVTKKSALMEQPPNTPVELEFVIDRYFSSKLMSIMKILRQAFEPNQIKFTTVYVDTVAPATCVRLTAKVGRGIVFWDRDHMLARMEDPFQSRDYTKKWLVDILMQYLPDVLAAANLRKAKKLLKKGAM